jgi:uncharacterized protein
MLKPPLLHDVPVFPKILLLVAIVIVTMIFTVVFGTMFAIPFWGSNVLNELSTMDIVNDPSTIAITKYFQIVSQLGIFIFPVLIFAFLDGRNIFSYLKMNITPRFIMVIIAALGIIFAMPLINFLAEMNMQMKLPSYLAGVEDWMRSSEDNAGKLTEVFLNVSTVTGFLVNLLMIAIIPAFGEEFLFRGVVQPLFHKWTKNIHVAVIISAFLFSAIHMQFYGFIPRFLMGVFLGYAFAWTGSLWVPVAIHFVNNGAAVILSFLFMNGQAGNQYETIGTGTAAGGTVVVSTVITAIAVYLMYFLSRKKKDLLPAL